MFNTLVEACQDNNMFAACRILDSWWYGTYSEYDWYREQTPLHWLVFHIEEGDKMKIKQILVGLLAELKASNDPNTVNQLNQLDRDGQTALHYACKKTSKIGPFLVTLLVEHGAEINAQDNRGYTPLHIAAEMKERVSNVQQLLELKAKPGLVTSNGWTPFMLARIKRNHDAMFVLISHFPMFMERGCLILGRREDRKIKKIFWNNHNKHVSCLLLVPDREFSSHRTPLKNHKNYLSFSTANQKMPCVQRVLVAHLSKFKPPIRQALSLSLLERLGQAHHESEKTSIIVERIKIIRDLQEWLYLWPLVMSELEKRVSFINSLIKAQKERKRFIEKTSPKRVCFSQQSKNCGALY